MNAEKATRGRPKTLDRDHVINTAMMSYWADGPMNVSLNEICKRAGVSKPGVYREFGGEDGLKQAVLSAYGDMLVTQFQLILDTDKTFTECLDALVELTLRDQGAGIPTGCLQVAMCNCTEQLGVQTLEKVGEIQEYILAQYANWVERAKANGEFNADILTRLAALYINEQVSSAMLQRKRGEANDDTRVMLTLALSVLV